jgi:hypothetical protein
VTVEQDLRETLQERAERVTPSPDAWASITLRIDHRRQRARVVVLAVAALLPVVAVGATLAAVRDGDGAKSVDTAGAGVAPSAPATTAVAAPPPGGPTTTAMRSTTTTPRKAAVAPNASTATIWPETAAEIDDLQKSFDQGHQPWRGSPDDVAKAFLADRGITEPQLAEHGTGAQVVVNYNVDDVGGAVTLARTRDGGIYYVTRHTSDRMPIVDIARSGDGLVLGIKSPTSGTVTARTKRPGGSWSQGVTQPVVTDGETRIVLAKVQTGDLILQLRHDGADGKVAIADQYMAATSVPAVPAETLGSGSKLRVDGLGPVRVGMTLGEAEGAAGVPMTRNVGPFCTDLSPTGGPAGVSFVSTGSDGRVDVVTVAEPGVTTVSGIGIGSTLEEVDAAYPSLERHLTGNEGRLVYRADDPTLSEFELVIGLVQGKVTQLWAGHHGLGMRDELCA